VFYGCLGSPQEITVGISDNLDDGTVYVLVELLPSAFGYRWGGGEGALVGVEMGDEHLTASRALLRFNLSEWTKEDVTFHAYCTPKKGDPGKLEVYVIPDFGKLPGEPRWRHPYITEIVQ